MTLHACSLACLLGTVAACMVAVVKQNHHGGSLVEQRDLARGEDVKDFPRLQSAKDSRAHKCDQSFIEGAHDFRGSLRRC